MRLQHGDGHRQDIGSLCLAMYVPVQTSRNPESHSSLQKLNQSCLAAHHKLSFSLVSISYTLGEYPQVPVTECLLLVEKIG